MSEKQLNILFDTSPLYNYPGAARNNRSPDDLRFTECGVDRNKFPRSPGLTWRRTYDLKIGDRIAYFCKPWETDLSHDGGWLSGIFDGEGSVSRSTRKEVRIPAWKVNISQNPGKVYNKIKTLLNDRCYEWYENVRSCPQVVLTGGWREVLRFLGTVRPTRLLDKLSEILSDMPMLSQDRTYSLANVTNIEYIGDSPVASIETSCGTFITEGYLTHNTYQCITRDTVNLAIKCTSAVVNGKSYEVAKDPKTDSGMKKSARGLLAVLPTSDGKDYRLVEQASEELENSEWNCLQTVFLHGKIMREYTLKEIRERLESSGRS